ncbi:MBL fold metallo-hydrolase [Flavobacterium marginilacus]|uniref:MBL fold metallo-hydrolase n=1 Tax=Flavobacterium marginilacus TaxID=3003256 RepID=UPI00248E232F|nr:MBL fold metallo-hydrolase [Flavobacterium marginilacus]
MALKKFNTDLKFIKENWKGNELNPKGLYTNLHGDHINSFKEVLKWQTNKSPITKLKKNQVSPLSWQLIDKIRDKSVNAIIPVGHACFIIDLNGTRLLIDPVITENRFLKRYTKVPFEIPDLNNVDYLLLSHNHRDHIDKESILQLCAYNPSAIILTGLEIGKILKSWGVKNEIQEAGWFQQFNTSNNISIDYLPSQHWSRRWLTDTNKNLWGGFMIKDKKADKTIFFAGDSGYAQHFAEIGKDYTIDIAMIGVGAYEPQWFMKYAHTGPSEAIRAFKDLKAKKWIPMHYGTFDLSDEPVYYPEQILKEKHKNELSSIIWMHIGQRISI